MRDITLEETLYHRFTSRTTTGVPTTLAGTPVLSIYEENNLTQITAGVSISADYDAITGLNQATIVATAANGYEAGKSYDLVITTGTVGGVSVVGEVVGSFTVQASAAATDLANATDGLTALKTAVDAIPTTAMRGTDNALLAASINLTAGAVDTVTTNTDMRGTDNAALATALATAQTDLDTITGADGVALASTQQSITFQPITITAGDAIPNILLTGTGTEDGLSFTRSGSGGLFGTNWAAALESEVNDALVAYDPPTKTEMDAGHALLATEAKQDAQDLIITEARLAELDAANIPVDLTAINALVAAVQTDLDNGTDGLGALKALIDAVAVIDAAIKVKTDSLTFTQAGQVDSNVQRINDVTITGDGSATPFDV